MSGASQTRFLWQAAIAIPVLLGAVALAQMRIDAETRSDSAQPEELVFRSGPLLKKLSLGYDPLLADIYWTRTVQYYGSRVGLPNAKFDLLAPLLDITTTLDPHLIVAYRFGTIFLSEPGTIGAGRTDLAIDLAKRGIAANPGEWRLYYDLGFLYYWRLKDYPNASATYLAGSKVPGAPGILGLMAARIAEQGGSIETSRMIFTELYKSSTDKNVRKEALKQLRFLKAQDDEAHLDQIIEQYTKGLGHKPQSMKDLVAAGFLPGAPVDPVGFPYVIGPDGKCHRNPDSPLAPTNNSP